MKRILFYCQHLLGIGHLTRSLAISEKLLSFSHVDFIQGGPEIGKTISHGEFTHHKVTPLLMDEVTHELYDPQNLRSAQLILEERSRAIEQIAAKKYDAVFVELFPFGRNKFKAEILKMLEDVRKHSGSVPVYCSVRDILVHKKDAQTRDVKTANIINQHFNRVFVHSDSDVIKLDETFTQVPLIEAKLHYTGFIAAEQKIPLGTTRKKQILVSQGGSDVGFDLLKAVARSSYFLPDYEFILVTGAKTPEFKKDELREIIKNNPRARVEGFLSDFQRHLCESALSISLGGYNTMMDLVRTRTPALVMPYMENFEQSMRLDRFCAKSFTHKLGENELDPQMLHNKIQAALQATYPNHQMNIAGAENTALVVKADLKA